MPPKVLILDEFGIWPYDRDAATAFFSLISARYDRASIILTSNERFAERGELLGDTVIATAILDASCITATCSTSEAKSTGSGTNDRQLY